MKIKTYTETHHVTPNGLDLTHEPVNGDDLITTLEGGKLHIRYIARDLDPESPDRDRDDGLFLVNYHRDFDVRRDGVITLDQVRNYYVNDTKMPAMKKYWLFKLNAYIHSGVVLGLAPTNFPDEQWDVSHVGLVLVAKEEWRLEAKARKAAQSLVEAWNRYLGGEVWGNCHDVFDAKTKKKLDEECESCWGYNGEYEDLLAELQKEAKGGK